MPPALHVVSWNVENLARHLDEEGKLAEIARSFGSPDVLCLQELKLRPADTVLLEHAKRALPGYDFACSLANDPKNAGFRGGRVYGVGTWVKSEIDATILDRFLRSNHDARELMDRARGYDVNRIRFQNPFIPLIYFTVGTGLEIVSKHEHRHLLQAERIRTSPAFPA